MESAYPKKKSCVTQWADMWRARAKYTLAQTGLTHAPFTQSIPTARCDANPVIQPALAKHTRSLRYSWGDSTLNWVFVKCAAVVGRNLSRRWRRSDGGREEVVGAEIPGARSSIPSPAFQGLECTHSPQSAPLSFNSRLTQESVPARLSPRKEQDL